MRFDAMLAPPVYGGGGLRPTYNWDMWEDLDGSGTETNHPTVDLGPYYGLAATLTPAEWRFTSQTLPVSPDTDYVWALNITDGLRVFSASMSEKPTHSIVAGTTGAVETGGMGWGQPVTSAQVGAIIDGADLLWKRSGKHLFSWTEYAGIARTTGSYRNAFDQTLDAWSEKSPGFYVRPRYMGSLDAPGTVACTFVVYAKVTNEGTGYIKLVTETGESDAAISVTSTTGAWYSGTIDLDGENADEKVDLWIQGTGTNPVTIYSASAWCHVA
jgi:hypothetical protein